jgi:outer membrane receptor protein involved in Fe transport
LADDTDWAKSLGFPNPFGVTGWPTICTDSPFFYYGCWDGDNRGDQHLTAYQLEDNVTWIKGKHSVKFGFKGRQEYSNVRELQQSQGSHSFYGDWTALYDPVGDQATSFTGSGFASMLLGLPTYLSNQYNRGYFYFQQKELGAYIHDSWRASPRLTLDLGLRWDKGLSTTRNTTGWSTLTFPKLTKAWR